MNAQFTPLLSHERDAAFSRYRDGMAAAIDHVYGWQEAQQRWQFSQQAQFANLFWYQENGRTCGLAAFGREAGGLRLYLLVIDAALRGQGIGARAMCSLQQLLRPGERLSLSCFAHQPRVLAFYQALGYQRAADEVHFHNLWWQMPC